MSELNRYELLCQYIKSLGKDVEKLDQQKKIAFISDSKNTRRTKGLKLVWLLRNYDPNNFRVWVRSETRGIMGTAYPNMIKTMSDYLPRGRYNNDSPSFNIRSDEDLVKAKKIIKFAYENL